MGFLELYDTTLRDGAQMEGISLSVDDKLAITERLDASGFHFIEGGYAGANPKEDEYFRRVRSLPLKNALITAFGNTRRAGGKVESDPVIQALLATETPVVTLVGKASEMQVLRVLETSLEENLAMIADSVTYLRQSGRRVIFDAEHFFDGIKANPEYAVQVARVAAESGAECVVLCDTNGGTLPDEIARLVEQVKPAVDAKIGIHTHDDTDTAVASALAAVEAGAVHIQGTVNGYGERCGNANLLSVAANLKLKMGMDCVTDEQMAGFTELSNFVAEAANMPPHMYQPYVGRNAFAHKGGLHSAAVHKVEDSYQHVSPELVGNARSFVVSELAGRGAVVNRLKDFGLAEELSRDDARRIIDYIKAKENEGFQYERAEASFELVVRRNLPNYEPPFELIDFRVTVSGKGRGSLTLSRALNGAENVSDPRENGVNGDGASHPGHVGSELTSEATVKVRIGEDVLHTAAEGNGPVNALDNALRKALLQSYPHLEVARLTDYKVRVVAAGTGTGAVVRVVIETSDGHDTWRTVGASANILEASWLALADSMEYWLLKHPASASKG